MVRDEIIQVVEEGGMVLPYHTPQSLHVLAGKEELQVGLLYDRYDEANWSV